MCLQGDKWDENRHGFDLMLDSRRYKCKYIQRNEKLLSNYLLCCCFFPSGIRNCKFLPQTILFFLTNFFFFHHLDSDVYENWEEKKKKLNSLLLRALIAN